DDVVAGMLVDPGSRPPSVQLPIDVPRLFLAFPLNGTEDLSIPMVLNSERFTPREERDGIFLGVGTNESNERNKSLFTKGCQLIVDLAALAAQQGWGNAPSLTTVQALADKPWAQRQWLRNSIKSVLIG